MPALDDVFAELRSVKAYIARRDQSRYLARSLSPDQVQNMALAAKLWPDLSPGSLMALGRGNVPADSPNASKLAELAAKTKLRDHPNGIGYGQRTFNTAMRRAQWRSGQQYVESQARRGAEAELLGGLRDAEGRLRAPADLDAFVSDYEYDPKRAAERAPQAARDIDRFVNLVREAAGEGEVTFIDPRGVTRAYNGKTNSWYTPEPGVQAQSIRDIAGGISGGLGNLQFPQVEIPGVKGPPQRTAGPTTLAEPVRETFMALNAPVQEVQGQVRNLYSLTQGHMPNWFEPQSDYLIAKTSGITDAGNGFFVDPESAVAQERRRREEERGQIGDHNVTLGRWAVDALTPFDPDTKPAMILSGLVDAGVQIYADPANMALARYGTARQASKLFAARDAEEAAGVVKGLRWVLRPVDPEKWADSDTARDVFTRIAGETSPTRIWQATNRKMPLRLARRLADEAHTPEEARAILMPELGTSIRRVSTAEALGSSKVSPIRVMPARGRIDAHDQDIVGFQVEAALRNVHADEDTIATIVDKVARADGPIKLNAAIRDSLRAEDGILAKLGYDEQLRDQVLKLHADAHAVTSDTFVTDITSQTPTFRDVMVNGQVITDPTTSLNLVTELAPRYLTFPDARVLRRLASDYRNIITRIPAVGVTGEGELKWGASALDFVMTEAWKPLQLMRAAWTIRVVGEEQLRMAAAGYDSMFKHPSSYIAWTIARDPAEMPPGFLAKVKSPFTTTKAVASKAAHAEATQRAVEVATLGRGNIRPRGWIAADEAEEMNSYKASLSINHGGWVDRGLVPTGIKTTYLKGERGMADRYRESLGSQLARLAGDPVANKLANSDSMDDAVEWFTRGTGNKFRSDLAAAYPGEFDTPEQARAYLERIQRRIDYHTGGNGDLLDAVKTGKLGGDDLLAGSRLNRDAIQRLDSYIDEFGPDEVVGQEMRTVRKGARDRTIERWDRFVDHMFGTLMTERTNNLSRSPTWRQAYYRDGERLVPSMTQETKDQFINQAIADNIPRRAIQRMEKAKPVGNLTFKEADFLAKGHALDETKELLYDLTKRGRFMDAARLVFPFGEAWSEVVTRWLGRDGLIANNPKVIRRFQQTIQAARGEDFGEVMGAPEGEGFFWQNEFGDEVFVYPGSSLLTHALFGVNIPLTGRVQGLSMFGSVIPGIGPAIQMPVGYILSTKPGPQWLKKALGDLEAIKLPQPIGSVREALLPFGATGESDQGEVVSLLSYVPPWMKTAFDFATNGDGNEKAWANSIMSMAASLKSTGNYGDTRGEMNRLMEDAEKRARWFYLVKAVGQFGAPAAPAAEWTAVTPNDGTVRLRALAEEYQKLKTENFEQADQRFTDLYGDDVLAAVQGKTAGIEYAVPTTQEGAQWVLEHPGIEDDLPHTYGFFAPQGGKFDYSLYERQLVNGDRVQLKPKTWIRLMNNTKGDLIWQQAKDEVGDKGSTDEGRRFLAETKAWIRENYPGWGDMAGMPERADASIMIPELYEAVGNEAVRDTDAGRGLQLYLEGRDEVMTWAESEGHIRQDGLLSGGKDMEDAHRYLADLADWVIDKHPGFKSLWDIVLSREIEEAESAD